MAEKTVGVRITSAESTRGITIRTDTKRQRQNGVAVRNLLSYAAGAVVVLFGYDTVRDYYSDIRTEKIADDVAIVQNYVDTGTNKLVALDAIRNLRALEAQKIAATLISKASDEDFVNTASLIIK